jgi:hypothetical protein
MTCVAENEATEHNAHPCSLPGGQASRGGAVAIRGCAKEGEAARCLAAQRTGTTQMLQVWAQV